MRAASSWLRSRPTLAPDTPAQVALKRVGQEWGITVSFRSTRRFWAAQRKWYWKVKEDHEYINGKHNRISLNHCSRGGSRCVYRRVAFVPEAPCCASAHSVR